MTSLLEQAIQELATLPADQQDDFARWLLAELSSDRQWQQRFDGSAPALDALADEALAEHRVGKSLPLDPEKL